MILLHGLGMTGLELARIRRTLCRAGFPVQTFRYATTRRSPAENAAELARRLHQHPDEPLHFVAHSLGGIVLCHLFDQHPELRARSRKAILLGTPLNGSAIARFCNRHGPLRWLLGKSLDQGLLGDRPRWQGPDDLIMIAGTRSFGPRLLLPGVLPRPNDGTVAVSETRTDEVRQHICVPHSHTAMLFARLVSDHIRRTLTQDEPDQADAEASRSTR